MPPDHRLRRAATAAHDVLVGLFPAQTATLDTTYTNYLNGLGLGGDPGADVGHQAAAGILSLRGIDASYPPVIPVFMGGTGPGEWRPDVLYWESSRFPCR